MKEARIEQRKADEFTISSGVQKRRRDTWVISILATPSGLACFLSSQTLPGKYTFPGAMTLTMTSGATFRARFFAKAITTVFFNRLIDWCSQGSKPCYGGNEEQTAFAFLQHGQKDSSCVQCGFIDCLPNFFSLFSIRNGVWNIATVSNIYNKPIKVSPSCFY